MDVYLQGEVRCCVRIVCECYGVCLVQTIYSYYVHNKPYYDKAVSFKKNKVKYIKE